MKVPFFKDADELFIAQIVTLLQINYYVEEDFVIEQGTSGEKMYFIESGVLEVIVGKKSVDVLNSGQFFGGNIFINRNYTLIWKNEANCFNQSCYKICFVFIDSA